MITNGEAMADQIYEQYEQLIANRNAGQWPMACDDVEITVC